MGCQQKIDEPTRQKDDTKTLLDLIITNSDHIIHHRVKGINVSDDDLVYVTRLREQEPSNPISFEVDHTGTSKMDITQAIFKI